MLRFRATLPEICIGPADMLKLLLGLPITATFIFLESESQSQRCLQWWNFSDQSWLHCDWLSKRQAHMLTVPESVKFWACDGQSLSWLRVLNELI